MAYDITGILDPKEIELLRVYAKELNGLDADMLKFLQDVDNMKTSFDKTAKSQDDIKQKSSEYSKILNKAAEDQNKLVATTKQLESQQKQLTTTEAKLKTAQTGTNKQLVEQKLKLQEVNKQTKDNIKNQNLINERLKTGQKDAKNITGAYQKLSNELNKQRALAKDLAVVYGKNSDQYKKVAKDVVNLDNKMKNIDSGLGQSQRKVGQYGDALGSLGGPFGSVVNGAKRANVAFKALLANPIVLVVAAIVAVFAGLVKIFKDTDDGGTKLASIFEGLKAVMDVLKNRVVDLMKATSLLFSGKFREAAKQYKESVSGVGSAMKEAYDEASKYVVALDQLEDRVTGSISSQAKLLRGYQEQLNLSKDQTKTDQERISAMDEAEKFAEKYYGNLKRFEQERFDLEAQNAAARIDLTAEELAEFIALDGDRQEELRNSNDKYAQAWNQLGDETIKGLEEQYAKMDEADSSYFKQMGKITSLRSGLENTLASERIAANKAANDQIHKQALADSAATMKLREDQYKLEKQAQEDFSDFMVNDEAEMFADIEAEEAAAQASFTEYEKAKADQSIAFAEIEYQQRLMIMRANSKNEEDFAQKKMQLDNDILQGAINSTQTILNNSELSADERTRLETELAYQQLELQKLVDDEDAKNTEKKLARQKEIKEATLNIANEAFNLTGALFDREAEMLERKNEKGLLSEQEYAIQSAKIQRKQAIAAKAQSLFNIYISTSEAAAKVSAQTGIGALVAAPLITAFGLLQAAAVVAQPLPEIPQFYKGTTNAPDTGIFGDRGRELMQTTSGDWYMADKPTLFSDKKFKGGTIYTNKQTEQIISETQHSGFGGSSFSDKQIVNKLDNINRTIKNQPQPILLNGNHVGNRRNGNTDIYINRMRKGLNA